MKIALRKCLPKGTGVAALLALSLVATVLTFGFIARSSESLQTAKSAASREQRQEVPQAAGWWLRYTNAADGYTLALPPDWRVVPLDREALDRYAQQAGSGDPAAAGQLASRARERLDAGAGLWAAVAPEVTPGSAASINIVRQPLGKEMSAEAFARANIADLRKEKGTPTPNRREWLALTTGKALRTEMHFQAPTPGGVTRVVEVTQFYLVYGQNGYVVTGVAPAGQAQDYAPIFEAVLRSLRWTT